MPDDDNVISAYLVQPAVVRGVPPIPLIPGAGGGGIPSSTICHLPARHGEEPRHTHTPFASHWPLADAATDLVAEKTGLCHDDARHLIDTWAREGTIRTRGKIGLAVATPEIPLTPEIWSSLLPLAHGSAADDVSGLVSRAVRGVRICAADLMAAGAALFGDPPPPTQPVPADPQAAVDEPPPTQQSVLTDQQPVADERPPASQPASTEHQVVEAARSPGEAADAQPAETLEQQERPFDKKAADLQLVIKQKTSWKTRPTHKTVEDFLLAIPMIVGDPPPRHDGRKGFTRAFIDKLITDRWGKGTAGRPKTRR